MPVATPKRNFVIIVDDMPEIEEIPFIGDVFKGQPMFYTLPSLGVG